MKDKKRRHPKSPEHIGNANKGPKKSESTISGYLVTNTRGSIIYTPSSQPSTPTFQDCEWRGDLKPDSLMPDASTPSPSESAEQTASTPSEPIGKITSADIASISSWKPKKPIKKLPSYQPLFPSDPIPATSEGINNKDEKPRKKHAASFEPKLDTILQSPPAPLASKNEAISSEDTPLMPTTPPTHVEHAQTSLPSLRQILDKELPHQTHAIKHATLNDPIPNSKSEPPTDTFVPPDTLLKILQSITALKHNTARMETEIVSLKEDNRNLRQFIHERLNEQFNTCLNQLANIVIQKINQATNHISINHLKDFDKIHNDNSVINDSIKNISLRNQVIEEKLASIELVSATVERKFDNLEKIVENLQLLGSDTPMDTTPTPHSNLPLPSATSNPRPPSFPHPGHPTRPSYANIAGSRIQHQSTTWQGTPVKQPQAAPTPFQNRNTRVIRFPQGNRFTGHRLTPQQVVLRVNQIHEHLPFKAILAKWTLKHNLTITFSKDSLDRDIDEAAQSIKQCLFPDNNHAIFGKAVNWSKIVFKNTPCRSFSINPEDNSIVAQDLSPNALLEAVRESHPLLEKASFVLPPEWTVKDLPEGASHHNLSFSIEDPDGSIANTLINTKLIMFASSVRLRLWKDKFVPAPSANIGPPPTPLPY